MSKGKYSFSDTPVDKKKKHTVLKRVILILVLVVLLCIIAVGGYSAFLVKSNYDDIEGALTELEKTGITQASKSEVYDSEGNLLVEISGSEYRNVVTFSEYEQSYIIPAVIATEDTRFYEHTGIDFIRLVGALVADIKEGGAAQGGSTISMQLARNAVLNSQDKTIDRKIKEMIVALKLEQMYTKEEILTFYLNEVFVGQNIYGIGSAANYYFSKNVADLTLGECAMLIGILPSPNAYAPTADMEQATRVRNQVLTNMVNNGAITQEEADAAKAEEIVLNIRPIAQSTEGYSHFIDFAIKEADTLLVELGYSTGSVYTGGFRVITTMNPAVQNKLDEIYLEGGYNFPKGYGDDELESAAIFANPKNGEIYGMAGGREYDTRFGYNRATDMLRQPGSIIKPVVAYGPALDEGYSPNYTILDAPFTGGYNPKNSGGGYSGEVSMSVAIKKSINTCAVRMLQEIGTTTGWEFGRKLGLPLVEEDDGPALALGGITYGVSPYDMATAYSCFASGGYRTTLTAVKRIESRYSGEDDAAIYEHEAVMEQVMEESTAYSMSRLLHGVVTGGTGTRANIGGLYVCGKTGTTQLPDTPAFRGKYGTKDAWFAGYTPQIVGTVWMGYDKDISEDGSTQYMANVYGGQYPTVIWRMVVAEAYKAGVITSEEFKRPSGYSYSISDYIGGSEEEEEEEEEGEEGEEGENAGGNTGGENAGGNTGGGTGGENAGGNTGGGTGGENAGGNTGGESGGGAGGGTGGESGGGTGGGTGGESSGGGGGTT
ncbi:MAG: PBP1A family penicillin-binding protein [Firmicutes bacterium]|nr:PBP1A family penicillin-binding protein [Bacillota bacterium]